MTWKQSPKTGARVRLRVLVSFNDLQQGESADVLLDARVQGWIKAGLVEVDAHGEDPAGQGSAEPDDHERVADGAARGEQAGGEPGEGFGAGSFGASAGLDQG